LGSVLGEMARALGRSVLWQLATRLPLVERVAQPAPGRTGWARIAVRGTAFLVPDHPWWRQAYAAGWEADTLRAYGRLIQAGDTVVDVGAWIGPTVMFACACGARRVLAVEPNPACRPYLDALVDAANRLGVELAVCSTGVHAVAGEVEFGTRTGEIATHSNASLAGRGVRIAVDRLPNLLAAHGYARPDFVKIDVEGAEFAIPDQIGAIGAHPGVRVFLSLHPPLVPAGADTSALTATLSGFDLYDARLAPLSHDEVAARVVSPERFPAWGTPLGNYFELMLVPRGEPLERKDADERKIRVSPGNS